MSILPGLTNQRKPLALVALASFAAVGLVLGLLLPPAHSSTFEHVQAWLSPISMAWLCIGLIRLQVKQRRVTLGATLLCCCSVVALLLTVLRT